MYTRKECVAMLLAGGQGSRLYALTDKIAKPAVSFGGKYRIIDFALSNCTNSGIDTVGVLTQYRPQLLNAYIGNGQPWDLDINGGGVFILPPYMTAKSGEWYKGTANAIYQNIDFIEQFSPKYVLIISGDQIYRMDYGEMIELHRKKGSKCTIAVTEVEWKEASRFGVMSIDENKRITLFEEKPKVPKSNLASMGIYVFDWDVLRDRLIADENDTASSNDFGKNIIPKMLSDGLPMYAYEYSGYWQDVGTINSFWEANMDLLRPQSKLSLAADDGRRIYTRNIFDAPHYIAQGAEVQNAVVCGSAEIYGSVSDSIIFNAVTVRPGAVCENSVVMANAFVDEGSVLKYAVVANGVHIGRNVRIGADPGENHGPVTNDQLVLIGPDVEIGDGCVIAPGTIVRENMPPAAGAAAGRKEEKVNA